ncbi:MAG: hypothetical protein HYZ47_04100 [Simkania negevensis]|nr:hypothetical protein [Simkania negevensis]
MHDMNGIEEKKGPSHHWKARILVGFLILFLSFIGLVISNLAQEGAWTYWRIMVPFFALLCLGLSWFLRRDRKGLTSLTIWHEVIHWLGLMFAVYLISIFVDTGLMERFVGSLVILTMLGLTIFVLGVYVEAILFLIGLSLGLFALAAALLTTYIYTVILPITIGVLILLVWVARKQI